MENTTMHLTEIDTVSQLITEMKRFRSQLPFPADPIHFFAMAQETMGEAQKVALEAVYDENIASIDDVRSSALRACAMLLEFALSADSLDWSVKC